MKYRQYKAELEPNELQKQKINEWLGVNRFVYNLYLTRFLQTKSSPGSLQEFRGDFRNTLPPRKDLVKPADFFIWLKNEYIPQTSANWIEDCPEDSLKETIWQAYRACKKYRLGKSPKPHFYRKGKDGKISFRRHGKNDHVVAARHFVEIPHLGKVTLKNKGYIPITAETHEIEKGHVALQNGRCWINVQVGFTKELPLKKQKPLAQKPVYSAQLSASAAAPISTSSMY